MSESPTAFVTGATGYVGRAVVRELRVREARTIAHVRPDSGRLAEWRTRFAQLGASVDTSAWEVEALSATLAALAPTHVFAAVGTTRARRKLDERETYQAIDLGLTRVLLDACSGLPTAPRFVYVSSLGSGPRARGDYLQTRWRCEEAVRASGLPFTIARPPLVTGPDRDERRPAETALKALMGPGAAILRRIGFAKQAARYAPTNADELAYGLVHAALNYTTIDRVLMPEELRYELANDREYHVPASRRDQLRH